jgi:hypothetical protein
MIVIGQYRDLDRSERFVWTRGFHSMEARPKKLSAFYDSELWSARRSQANASIDDADNVLLLEPASPGLRFKDIPPRPVVTELTPAGLVVAMLQLTREPEILRLTPTARSRLRGLCRHSKPMNL